MDVEDVLTTLDTLGPKDLTPAQRVTQKVALRVLVHELGPRDWTEVVNARTWGEFIRLCVLRPCHNSAPMGCLKWVQFAAVVSGLHGTMWVPDETEDACRWFSRLQMPAACVPPSFDLDPITGLLMAGNADAVTAYLCHTSQSPRVNQWTHGPIHMSGVWAAVMVHAILTRRWDMRVHRVLVHGYACNMLDLGHFTDVVVLPYTKHPVGKALVVLARIQIGWDTQRVDVLHALDGDHHHQQTPDTQPQPHRRPVFEPGNADALLLPTVTAMRVGIQGSHGLASEAYIFSQDTLSDRQWCLTPEFEACVVAMDSSVDHETLLGLRVRALFWYAVGVLTDGLCAKEVDQRQAAARAVNAALKDILAVLKLVTKTPEKSVWFMHAHALWALMFRAQGRFMDAYVATRTVWDARLVRANTIVNTWLSCLPHTELLLASNDCVDAAARTGNWTAALEVCVITCQKLLPWLHLDGPDSGWASHFKGKAANVQALADASAVLGPLGLEAMVLDWCHNKHKPEVMCRWAECMKWAVATEGVRGRVMASLANVLDTALLPLVHKDTAWDLLQCRVFWMRLQLVNVRGDPITSQQLLHRTVVTWISFMGRRPSWETLVMKALVKLQDVVVAEYPTGALPGMVMHAVETLDTAATTGHV
jgi:hypothetical protein